MAMKWPITLMTPLWVLAYWAICLRLLSGRARLAGVLLFDSGGRDSLTVGPPMGRRTRANGVKPVGRCLVCRSERSALLAVY